MKLQHPYGGGAMMLTRYEAWCWLEPRLNSLWWRFCLLVSFTGKAELYNLSCSHSFSNEPISKERWAYINKTMKRYYMGWGIAAISLPVPIIVVLLKAITG